MAFVTDIIPESVLFAPPHQTIQYHPSLLPRHRGASAINWAIIQGDTTTGLTIFWPDAGIDTGPILLQREVPIGEQDSVGSLYFERLYPLGVELLVDAVRQVREGTAPRVEQNHALATYEPPLEDDHGIIDWTRPGRSVFDHIRGCDPQPGARAQLNGASVRLFNARYTDGMPDERPGTVVSAVEDGPIDVAVIGGTLHVGRLQREGEAKVAAGALASTGDVLGRAS